MLVLAAILVFLLLIFLLGSMRLKARGHNVLTWGVDVASLSEVRGLLSSGCTPSRENCISIYSAPYSECVQLGLGILGEHPPHPNESSVDASSPQLGAGEGSGLPFNLAMPFQLHISPGAPGVNRDRRQHPGTQIKNTDHSRGVQKAQNLLEDHNEYTTHAQASDGKAPKTSKSQTSVEPG